MNTIGKHLEEVSEAMTLLDQDVVESIVKKIRMVRDRGGYIFVVGNGGSSATASHFANDLVKANVIRTICLSDMTALVTAYGNDTGWENMYIGPLRKFTLEYSNDLLVVISCSGNSKNVVRPAQMMREMGNRVVVLTGPSHNSELAKVGINDVAFHAMADDIRVQEDIHMMVCHMISRRLQEPE